MSDALVGGFGIPVSNLSEYTIAGDNVITEGQRFELTVGNQTLQYEFQRAIDQTSNNQTWTMQTLSNGVSAGTAVSVITDAGADIYYIDPNGNRVFQGHLPPGSIKR